MNQKDKRLLPALLGSLPLGFMIAVLLVNYLRFDTLVATPLDHAYFLPHLLIVDQVRQPLLQGEHLEFVVPAFFIAHAAFVICAVLVAGAVKNRHPDAAWATWLMISLDALAFYVAQFTFIHPAGPSAYTEIEVRVFDYLAVAAFALGAWALLRFALLFPTPCDPDAFAAHLEREFDRQQAAGTNSKSALRRWLNRGATPSARDRVIRAQRRFAAFARSPWLPAVVGGLGWALLVVAQFAPAWGRAASLTLVIGGYIVMLILITMWSQGWSVLEWHRHGAAPVQRKAASKLWWTLTVAGSVCSAAFVAGLLLMLLREGPSALAFLVLSAPVIVVVMAFAFLVAIAVATWSAPRPSHAAQCTPAQTASA